MITKLTCFFWDKREVIFSVGTDNVSEVWVDEDKVIINRTFLAPVVIHISKSGLGENHRDNLRHYVAEFK